MRAPESAQPLPHSIRMQICPNCANELDDLDIICASCGHLANAPTQPPASPPVAGVPGWGPVVVPGVAAAKPKKGSPKIALASAAIGTAAVVLLAAIFIVRSAGSNAQASAPGAATVTVSATSAGVAVPGRITQPDSTIAPKWARTRQSQWATDGSRTIGFEVEAEREVPVYMDRVRPVLAVRCISRQTEVFVVLRSAPSIERGADTHTVRIGLDDQPYVEERWLDSSDMHALFSPDGKEFAARMAAARRLRFGFTPFNALPAVVEFDVHGFDGPLAAMAKVCAPTPKRGRSALD
jgi:hypothetical protein